MRALLFALSERLPPEPEKRAEASHEQQRAAFQTLWKADPAAMDAAWRKWVLREYRKK
jgi:hypothetical protein